MDKRLILWMLAAVATLGAEQRPNFSGVWKLNEPASGTSASAPREIVWKIDHIDPRFKYSLTGMRGYMPFAEQYEFTTDGKMPADRSRLGVCAVWEADGLVLRYVKDEREFARFTLRISGSGKQMTREGSMSNVRIREVYDRQ